jgi:hypothetical protein
MNLQKHSVRKEVERSGAPARPGTQKKTDKNRKKILVP